MNISEAGEGLPAWASPCGSGSGRGALLWFQLRLSVRRPFTGNCWAQFPKGTTSTDPLQMFCFKVFCSSSYKFAPINADLTHKTNRNHIRVGIEAELFEFFERIWAWMSRILKLYDSKSLASDLSDSTSSEVDSIDSWITYQKFDFFALKLAQNYVLLIRLVKSIKMKLFPVFLLYSVSICPRPSYLHPLLYIIDPFNPHFL